MSILAAYAVPHPPLIIPEIGRGEQRKIQKTIDAYREVARRIALHNPETLIVSTPHSIMYSNYIHISPGKRARGDFGRFGHADVAFSVQYDDELASRIAEMAQNEGIFAGMEGEKDKSLDHGVMVPLHFIDEFLDNYKLVRISLSGLSPLAHYKLGMAVADAALATGRKTVFVASGDLSHKLKIDGPYGFAPEGPAFDEAITTLMAEGEFGKLLEMEADFCDRAAECGWKSFIIMAGALDGKAVNSELISYEGPFGVGYAVAAFEITGEDPNRHFGERYLKQEKQMLDLVKTGEDEYVKLARASLEYYFKHNKHLPMPAKLADDLSGKRAGVFVSLKLDGRLRGCIGTIEATTASLAEEIIQNAVSAGFRDPRFEPVSAEELDRLVYSVDVLFAFEPIGSANELDPNRYGVIVRYKGRSGLLLPNLEGIDTPEEQLRIALRKGNISPEDDFVLERFEVVRHH